MTPTAGEEISMSFTEAEIAYLRSQPVARLATLGSDEQPDVTAGEPGMVIRVFSFRE